MNIDLASLGWDAAHAAEAARFGPVTHDRPGRSGGDRPGRVSRVDRGVCTVLCADGPVRASLAGAVLAAAARDPVHLPSAGDWVLVRTWPDDRITLEVVLPRRTAIVRRTADKDATGQVLAANADAAAVVEAMHPAPDPARIERLLALGWESGARPFVILTKCDLVADPALVAADVARVAPDVEVIPVSAQRGDGLTRVRPHVARGRTLALLGPSGVGKSTLVNALAGSEVMTTQAIRRADGKGKHTTTYRALIPIPGGGAVLDTPGVRQVGLLDAAEGLDQAFADIAALAAACRFGDCAHAGEPGCAVREALDTGELAPRRWESWLRLQREVAFETRRRDARIAAQEKAARRR